MKEIEIEKRLSHLGTIKKKADLLRKTDLTPAMVNGAVRRMGEKLPVELKYAEPFALELFDFLADDEHPVFDQCTEAAVREDLIDYITGEVWQLKHKTRTIKNSEIAIFMDVRKLLKDHRTAQAMLINRSLKNHEISDRSDLRIAFQEEVEKMDDNILENYFISAGLLPGTKPK